MSKVYNKIVQSNIEPSKNDIWLKDGKFKTFSKEGWKNIGGVDEKTLNDLIKGGKEIYNIDLTTWNGKEDYDALYEAVISGKTVCLNNYPCLPVIAHNKIQYLTFSYYEPGESGAGLVGYMITFSDDYAFAVQPTIIKITDGGDGTKFLSNDGEYKTVSTPYYINIEDDTISFTELKNAIETNRPIFIIVGPDIISSIVSTNIISSSEVLITFYAVVGSGTLVYYEILVNSDNSITYNAKLLNFESVLYTAQTLEESQKAQARDNIGIEPLTPLLDHLVVSYLLNPYLVIADGEIPTEFVNNGELKYKYSNMYLVSYNGNHYRPSNISVDGIMTFIADGIYYEVNVTQDDNSTTGYSWDIAEKTA